MSLRRKKGPITLVAVLAVALALVGVFAAACGSSEETTTTVAPATTAPPTTAAGAGAGAKDIVDTAVAAGSFQHPGRAANQAAGLVDTLKGAGPFTVFAPADDAFATVPEGDLPRLAGPADPTRGHSPRYSPTTWYPAR